MKLTKIAIVLVVSLLAFSLAACSAPKDSETTSTSSNTDIATLLAMQPKNAEEAAELHQKLMQKENEILASNSKLWEKVFLAANKDMFGGKIIGIEPGSGLMRDAAAAVEAYGSGMELVEGSTAAMTAALDSAMSRKEPIAVTVRSSTPSSDPVRLSSRSVRQISRLRRVA